MEATQKLILMIKCNIRVRSTLPNLRIRSHFLTIEGVRSQKIEIPPIWPSLKKKTKKKTLITIHLIFNDLKNIMSLVYEKL